MPTNGIAILGAGISGITSALVLQESGFATTVYSQLRADRDIDRNLYPDFSSIFPAACIIPHTVEADGLLALFEQSQNVFARLAQIPPTGVRWQEHYELEAGSRFDFPQYARVLQECIPFGTSNNHLPFDQSLGSEVCGWVARVLFAEMPIYLEYLFRRYILSGGQIVSRRLVPDEFRSMTEFCVVNCSGLWARSLFGDSNVHPIRGRLLFVQGAPFPPLLNRAVFSYNYKPPDEQYPYDVYFFPRSGDSRGNGRVWLLGGSREIGQPGGNGDWMFPPIETEMNGGIPAPLEDINRTILHTIGGVDISLLKRTGYSGLRPGRTGGIRLEPTVEEGKAVVHNYGHGGAGVALSWGCALRVREIINTL